MLYLVSLSSHWWTLLKRIRCLSLLNYKSFTWTNIKLMSCIKRSILKLYLTKWHLHTPSCIPNRRNISDHLPNILRRLKLIQIIQIKRRDQSLLWLFFFHKKRIFIYILFNLLNTTYKFIHLATSSWTINSAIAFTCFNSVGLTWENLFFIYFGGLWFAV